MVHLPCRCHWSCRRCRKASWHRPTLPTPFGVVVLVGSQGARGPIETILGALPPDFPAAVVVLRHAREPGPQLLAGMLAPKVALEVALATDRSPIHPGVIHVAPAGRHLVVRRGARFGFDDGPHVEFARPSGSVLLQSAAAAFGPATLAVVLSGNLRDGTRGAAGVKAAGGLVLAQSPSSCEARGMPSAAIAARAVDFVLPPHALASAVISLTTAPGMADIIVGRRQAA